MAGVKAGCVHLCRVAGNTVWSHTATARDTPQLCRGTSINGYTVPLPFYLLLASTDVETAECRYLKVDTSMSILCQVRIWIRSYSFLRSSIHDWVHSSSVISHMLLYTHSLHTNITRSSEISHHVSCCFSQRVDTELAEYREHRWLDAAWLRWSASCLWLQRTSLDRRRQRDDERHIRTSLVLSPPVNNYMTCLVVLSVSQ